MIEKDNVHIHRSETGAFVKVNTASGTLFRTYDSLQNAAKAASRLCLIDTACALSLSHQSQFEGADQYCEQVDVESLLADGFLPGETA